MTNLSDLGQYPYVIHACPLTEDALYPTHTHGLSQIDMPEFMMDPLSFGPEENARIINLAYKYFTNVNNTSQLQSILNGTIIKILGSQLDPFNRLINTYVYCFRRVDPTFEGIKLAYSPFCIATLRLMKFIQIWSDGDDQVLTDQYYVGGVTA